MKKQTILTILLIMLIISIITVYQTFALDEESESLENSNADYNLIYSLKQQSDKQITVGSKEVKYVDISLENPYTGIIKYGMYYYLLSPDKMPDNVIVTLSDDSVNSLEDTIKPNETKSISIKITNNSEYQIIIQIGALVGFENGQIEDLAKNGEVLIK